MNNLEEFKKVIKTYLDERASKDALFAETYKKPNKSIDECCEYILSEVRKKGNAVFMKDEEVYGMAVHYYDEDKISFKKVTESVSVNTPKKVEESSPCPPSPSPSEPKNESKKSAKNNKREALLDSLQLSLFPEP